MEWIKVLNRHVLFEYNDLRDSEFVAWIKIMALTAELEHEPTREQILKYVNYQTLNSLSEKLHKHSIDLSSVLHKVLIDVSSVSHMREVWKNKKKRLREDNKNVPGDVPGDVPRQDKIREDKIREDKNKEQDTADEPPFDPPKENQETPPKETFTLPDWIPQKTWDEFQKVRKKKRAACTPYAHNLVVKELVRIRDQLGQDPVMVLNKSITSGWADVYPLKDGNGNGEKKHAGIKAWLARDDDEEAGQGEVCEGDGGTRGDIRSGAGAI